MTIHELTKGAATPMIDDEAFAVLSSRFRGHLLRPGDDGYDAARQVWNAMIDRCPALIARCAGVADVISAVDFARTHDVPVAVRGGGHSAAGNAVCDGGLVIDLSRMKGIRVDPATQTVSAEGGVTWGELDHEAQAFGLATTGGTVSTTGITGLTLGGGFGWLMRRFGYACDNLLAADIVTVDGRLVHASAAENPDLFWGLRGGGGNFGVVTALTFQLHEVGPMLVAGPLFHPLDAAGDVLRFYRDFAPTAPDALGCLAGLLTSPDGVPLAALVPVYSGPTDAGEVAVRPLRAFGSPVADLVAPVPYQTVQTLFDAAFPAGRRNYWKSSFLPALDDAAIDILVDGFARAPSPYAGIAIEQHGGAASRVGPEETAFRHRSWPFNLLIFTSWNEPAQDAPNMSWARELWAALQPFMADGVYVNYLVNEGESRVRAAYGADTYNRLAALKRRYDPTNFFRHNQNIAPADNYREVALPPRKQFIQTHAREVQSLDV